MSIIIQTKSAIIQRQWRIPVTLKPLDYYVNLLRDGSPFTFARFGDGEWNAILGAPGANCDGHEFFPQLGKELTEALLARSDYCYGMQTRALKYGGRDIRRFLDTNGLTIPWHDADVFHYANNAGTLFPLVEQLRRMKVVVIGPEHLRAINEMLFGYDHFIEIPAKNCFLSKSSVVQAIREYHSQHGPAVFAFSASMAANCIIHDVYPELGSKSWFIDFGSLWDVYAGVASRSGYGREDWHARVRRNCGFETVCTSFASPRYSNYKPRPAISLVVATYEHPDFLEKILVSLQNQSFHDFEIVLADDGSGPEIAELVKRHSSRFLYPVRHVRHEHQGFRKTVIVNKAVRESTGAYLIFVDGDCVLHHRFIERHFANRRMKRILCGRRVMLDRPLTQSLTVEDVASKRIEKPSVWWRHCKKRDRKHGIFVPFSCTIENVFRTRYAILGCNFSLFRNDFLRVNGYDERIIGRGKEDNNLCARLGLKGLAMKTIVREAIQYHLHHEFDPVPHSEEAAREFCFPTDAWGEQGISKPGTPAKARSRRPETSFQEKECQDPPSKDSR
jgi:glycosyltransferase involved in cell wall biosynthesis